MTSQFLIGSPVLGSHMSMRKKALEILLIEDNPDHALLTKVVFSDCSVRHRIRVLGNGEEACKFLLKESPYHEAPTPNLIILDLDLPGKSGAEILQMLKAHSHLAKIPVLVLSAYSPVESLVSSALADCYYEKPPTFQLYRMLAKDIESKWLKPLAS